MDVALTKGICIFSHDMMVKERRASDIFFNSSVFKGKHRMRQTLLRMRLFFIWKRHHENECSFC